MRIAARPRARGSPASRGGYTAKPLDAPPAEGPIQPKASLQGSACRRAWPIQLPKHPRLVPLLRTHAIQRTLRRLPRRHRAAASGCGRCASRGVSPKRGRTSTSAHPSTCFPGGVGGPRGAADGERAEKELLSLAHRSQLAAAQLEVASTASAPEQRRDRRRPSGRRRPPSCWRRNPSHRQTRPAGGECARPALSRAPARPARLLGAGH